MSHTEMQRRLERIVEELKDIANERRDNDDVVIVSCKEAARLLGVSPKTVSMMLRDGRLDKSTIGGSTGIRLSQIRDIKTQ